MSTGQLNLAGEVVDRSHPDYEGARQVWNGMVDRRPALIARCAGVPDVQAAVRYGVENGLPLAVRGGGHSVAGHSVCDDGVVVDLSLLRTVELDGRRRRVRVGGGALLGELDRATSPHGLVVPAGHVSHTGIGGLTLGGGTGWLMRKWGLTIDSLRSVQVVTAAGEVLAASEHEHSDLFWALRGGGGNFGVVAEFEFELHELGPVIFAGMLLYPLDRAVDVLAFSHQWMAAAPDELTTFPVFMTVPPVEPFPPALQGRPALAYGLAYAGNVDEGSRVVDELRSAHPAALDLVGPMPYTALQTMIDASAPHGLHHYNRSDYLEAVDGEVAEVLVTHFERVPSPHAQVITARMGGAVARVDAGATAFPHREAPYLVWIANGFSPTDEPEPHLEWGRALHDALRPFATGDVYVNALADEGEERVRAAYGRNWDRLRDVKGRYDPDNLFRGNANIPPSEAAGDAYWWLGTLATVKLAAEQSGGALSVIEVVVPEGYAAPPHVHHNEDETFLLLDGELTFVVGEDTIEAVPGNVLFGPRGIAHHFRVDAGPAKLLYLLTPGGFENFVREAGEPARSLTLPPDDLEVDVARVGELARRYGNEVLA